MANGKTHLIVGAGVGVTVALMDNKKHPISHNLVSSSAVGALMGKLPDILEPAHHPHHRQFFHSVATFVSISAALIKAYQWTPESSLEKVLRGVILIGGTAYLSHLAFDATTPRSLPILGKL